MKKLTILFLSILFSCTVQEESRIGKYWVGNWAFLDEGLCKEFPYTEIYLNDTAYVIQNRIYGIGLESYEVSNDSLYLLSQGQHLVGKMELLNDSVIQVYSPDKEFRFYKILDDGGYKAFGREDEKRAKAFLDDFENRALDFYLKMGVFKSKEDYERYQDSVTVSLPDEQLEELIDIDEIK